MAATHTSELEIGAPDFVPGLEVGRAVYGCPRLRAVRERAALVANEPPLAVVRLPGRRRVVAGVVDNRVAGVVVGVSSAI